MSKSAIYVVNDSAQSVVAGGLINPGIVVRRFGPNIKLVNTGIELDGQGYYALDVNVNLSATEVGDITVTALRNGVAIPGAVATQTAAGAGDLVNLSISALIREVNCYYFDQPGSLTFEVSGVNVDITNFSARVIKL